MRELSLSSQKTSRSGHSTMRSTEEFRKHQMDMLAHAFLRPSMYGGTEWGTELFFGQVLGDLCWIDEREREWERAKEQYLWGSAFVRGQFFEQHLRITNYLIEIATTYAQVAHMLGYFRPDRLLST